MSTLSSIETIALQYFLKKLFIPLNKFRPIMIASEIQFAKLHSSNIGVSRRDHLWVHPLLDTRRAHYLPLFANRLHRHTHLHWEAHLYSLLTPNRYVLLRVTGGHCLHDDRLLRRSSRLLAHAANNAANDGQHAATATQQEKDEGVNCIKCY